MSKRTLCSTVFSVSLLLSGGLAGCDDDRSAPSEPGSTTVTFEGARPSVEVNVSDHPGRGHARGEVRVTSE